MENGGEIKVGERLRRIEDRLDSVNEHVEDIKTQLHERITKHRENNERTVKELATSIVEKFGDRVALLEQRDAADEAVKSYRKWLIGVVIVGIGGLIIQLITVARVLA